MKTRNTKFVPVSQILIYSNGESYYAEESNLPQNGGWGYTKPLSQTTISSVFKSLAKKAKTRIRFGGYIPPNMLGFKEEVNFNRILWRTEAKKETLLFTKEAKIKNGIYHIPGLIWNLSNSLDLYAYKKWEELDTELYKPPFLNISGEDVCLGSGNDWLDKALKVSSSYTLMIQAVETAFFFSKFSHTGHDSSQVKGNLFDMYTKSKTAFPYEFLIPMDKTLKSIIDEDYNT